MAHFRKAVPAALVGALAAGGTVFAHARLVSSDPSSGAHLKSSPAHVAATFSEPLTLAFSRLSLGRAGGATTPLKGLRLSAPRTLTADLPTPLAPGGYVLVWRAVSTDSHRTEGKVPFTVEAP